MIIDAHQHVFWHGHSDRELIADMDAHGIDLAWLLTWEAPDDEDAAVYLPTVNPRHVRADGTHAGLPLSDVLTAREHYPDRFVLGYCPNPQTPNAPALLESACKMHGASVCGEWKYRMLVDDPRCLELFRKAGELGCPVVVHLDVPYLTDPETGRPRYCPLWYGGTIENLRRAVEACPQTVFLGHGPGFWREISADADANPKTYPDEPVEPTGRLSAAMESCPNLCADLSANSALGALKRDPTHAVEFLSRFADRLLFGRDLLGGDLHDFLQSLLLPRDVLEKVLFRNALRLAPPGEAADPIADP
jgi:predicted TIM-barrel fold metal-dependent hydrolase